MLYSYFILYFTWAKLRNTLLRETIYKNSNLTVVHVKFLEGLHNSQKPTKATLGNSEKWAHMGPTKKP